MFVRLCVCAFVRLCACADGFIGLDLFMVSHVFCKCMCVWVRGSGAAEEGFVEPVMVSSERGSNLEHRSVVKTHVNAQGMRRAQFARTAS